MTIDYDDSQLRKMWADLEPKRRNIAMRGAFRAEARRVKKVVEANIRAEGIHTNRTLLKGVRALPFRHKGGFRVTVGEDRKRRKGYYKSERNRNGREVPVLMWMDTGTSMRTTRGKGFLKKRGRANRGKLKAYGFMVKTREQISDSVTGNLQNEIIKSVQKTAKKYGCS